MKKDNKLLKIVEQIHIGCHEICRNILGTYLPVSGNLGVFCQSDEEHTEFSIAAKELTHASNNPNQKYFELVEPIVFESKGSIPAATYTHLYIRKFDPTPYGKYLGDVDFVLTENAYQTLKKKVLSGEIIGAKMYDRAGWDTIVLTDPAINAVSYVSTQEFAEKVRIEF